MIHSLSIIFKSDHSSVSYFSIVALRGSEEIPLLVTSWWALFLRIKSSIPFFSCVFWKISNTVFRFNEGVLCQLMLASSSLIMKDLIITFCYITSVLFITWIYRFLHMLWLAKRFMNILRSKYTRRWPKEGFLQIIV